MAPSIEDYFSSITDPGKTSAPRHKFDQILTLAICAVICGAGDGTEFVSFGESKLEWARTFLEWSHGIPSHDTFGVIGFAKGFLRRPKVDRLGGPVMRSIFSLLARSQPAQDFLQAFTSPLSEGITGMPCRAGLDGTARVGAVPGRVGKIAGTGRETTWIGVPYIFPANNQPPCCFARETESDECILLRGL